MNTTHAIICQINFISDFVTDGWQCAVEMQKMDAIEDARLHIQAAKDRLPRAGAPSNEGMFG